MQGMFEEEIVPLAHGDSDATNNQPAVASTSRSSTWRLYLSHFLSTWNSRVFEFGAVLYLTAIFDATLAPMSIYAVARAASAIVVSPALGHYIDTHDRLRVVRTSIVSQRVAVALSCAGMLLLLMLDTFTPAMRYLMLGLLSALACIEKAGSVMNLVSVEKDWVVEVAAGNVQELSALNAQMRRIDLLCKLTGPLVIALLIDVSTRTAIVVNLAMNMASLPIEYFAIAGVYKECPALRRPKQAPGLSSQRAGRELWSISGFKQAIARLVQQNAEYITHKAFMPSFALSLLYLTVLSFAGQMVAYLVFVGYSSLYVGLTRTAAVVLELSATWAAPLLMDRIGPVRAGAWFATWQTLTLAAGVAFFAGATPSRLAASSLVAGTVLSRIGLRGFELAAQIVVQDEVEADCRGSFSSVEASWQNFFELCAFASTIVFAKPQQFLWPVLISLAATAGASVIYAWFVRRRRGHLVHFSDCIGMKKGKQRSVHSASEGYELLTQHGDSNRNQPSTPV